MRCDGLVAEVADWAVGLEEVHARIAGAIARSEPRARGLAYLRGLLGQLERKTGWPVAARAGAGCGSPARAAGAVAGLSARSARSAGTQERLDAGRGRRGGVPGWHA